MSKSPAPFDQGPFLTHLQKGREFFDHDQLEKAREELEAANQIRPHDEKVLNMLGMTYYKLEMLPKAEEMYIVLAASNPEIYALQSNLGLIQLKLNKLEEARDSLNRALELQPANSKAHFYMGLLFEKKEMWEEALYHFEQAKAEKMIAKMKVKMEEQRNEPELVLPYEVIEVIQSESDSEPTLASIVQEEMADESSAEVEITGRMRAHDLAQAMFQIHNDELIPPPEPSEEEEPEFHTESIEQPVDSSGIAEAEPEDKSAIEEDNSAADLMMEQIKKQIRDESPWEKTHPSLFPEHFGVEPDSIAENESRLLIGSAVDEPFLLSEEIAADISTFLAESRTEENPEEDVFYQEPVLPEFTIVNSGQQPDLAINYPVESDEYRIPTPEEVENEIAAPSVEPQPEAESEPAALSTDEEPVEPIASEPVAQIPIEEHVEELLEEIPIEKIEEPPSATVEEEQTSGEDLEVNFAVNEGEEDGQIEQGFLQPSYLTPDFEERNLEQTQDMAYSPMARESAPRTEDVPEKSVQDGDEHAMPPAPAEEIEEPLQNSAQMENVSEIPIAQDQTETIRPANLDQFSRDRLYIQPLVGSDRFLLIDPHLLEIIISEKLFCRTGTISSYTGNLQFSPWEPGENKQKTPLIVVSGNGILFLADRRKEIFLISLNNEVIFVESNHLLVAQSSLSIEPHVFPDQSMDASFSVSKVSGRGTLALTCLTKPLTVNVHDGLPANIPAQAVIAWSGRVVSEVLDDKHLRKVMMSSNQESMFLRFRGTGDVVVEQGGLWGDRRAKRQ